MMPQHSAPKSRPKIANVFFSWLLLTVIYALYNAHMNSNLNLLQPYPFQRLRDLFSGITPNTAYSPINLSIGEPKHTTPQIIKDAVVDNLAGLANYPTTVGVEALRLAISNWITRRYNVPALNPEKAILPITGSREALFAFAQVVIDSKKTNPIVISPNPFYQIYEGAAFLAGATPYFLNTLPESGHAMDFSSVPHEVFECTQLLYVCSPGNPSGKVMSLEQWKEIFALSDKYGFVIAADECYSEIYFDETNPPLGALQAAYLLGRHQLETPYKNLIIFSSLSKRSNVPGMRSGFVAGDEKIIEAFTLYRTYHGCAMNPVVQAASITAWNDEAHVIENRRLYTEKFNAVTALLSKILTVEMPDAAFYLWLKTPIADADFALRLYRDFNVTVLPGSLLAREAHSINPGENFVRLALVASLDECVEAAKRIQTLVSSL